MYSYIKGVITQIVGNHIVLDNSQIGYQIKTPNPYSFTLNKEVIVYTYLHVREDVFDLYGFKTPEERDLFLKLLSVKGIGPKGALAIIASGDIKQLEHAIQTSDAKYLQRFPGIGPKASGQIILDLQGKLNSPSQYINHPKLNSVKEALKSLGYTNQELKRVEQIVLDNEDATIEELIKLSLKKLF
ncbi:MAG: Holliday junction branch migration protein RuvA [Bacilli bacterium]|jgi:Holliday junction DNA helicase RuvA|nr:Holliday junction branch migration protein RuvA [Bacilli bacterium]MDY0064056.1 Holliday junction branch migration protein RuvA [Bacilli bacterium]